MSPDGSIRSAISAATSAGEAPSSRRPRTSWIDRRGADAEQTHPDLLAVPRPHGDPAQREVAVAAGDLLEGEPVGRAWPPASGSRSAARGARAPSGMARSRTHLPGWRASGRPRPSRRAGRRPPATAPRTGRRGRCSPPPCRGCGSRDGPPTGEPPPPAAPRWPCRARRSSTRWRTIAPVTSVPSSRSSWRSDSIWPRSTRRVGRARRIAIIGTRL